MSEKYNKLQMCEDLSLRFGEPTWRLEQRLTAVKQYETLAMPKYEKMPINHLDLFNLDVTPYFMEAGNVYNFVEKNDQMLIVQEEEQTIIEQVPMRYLEQGVICTDLMTAFNEHSELVEKYFMSVVKPDNKVTAFHSAFLTSGVFIYIPENVVIDEPLEALFMQNKTATSTFSKHVLIVAEKNSQLTYIEHLTSAQTSEHRRSGNLIVEIIAKEGANIRYSAIDESADNMDLFIERKSEVEKDATVDYAFAELNHGHIFADFDIELSGDGSSANQHIIAISTNDDQQLIDTKVNHYGKYSTGDIMQRGVVLQNGDLRFNGIGHIYPKSTQAKTTQESRLMMMTATGRGDANPMLLIDHDDVVASHAASVGQLDVETLFYLMSRGLSEEQVIRLQTYAFLSPVLKAMPNKKIQDELFVHLERALD